MFLFFRMKYAIYSFFNNLLKPKKKEYIMFFLGEFPKNFKLGFKTILDYDSKFRYLVGAGNIVVIFNTTKTQKELHKLFNVTFSEQSCIYFLSNANNYVKKLTTEQYNYLYGKENTESIDKSLNRVDKFIEVIQNMKNQLNSLLDKDNHTYDIDILHTKEKELTMEDINPILDKIKESGMSSLTDLELKILTKYTKND